MENIYPGKIKKFVREQQTKYSNHSKAGLVCLCGCDSFSIRFFASVRKSMFGSPHLVPVDEKATVTIEAICEACGKVISLFDSRIDGYDNQFEPQLPTFQELTPSTELLSCPHCRKNGFTVEMEWEYPDYEEKDEIGECFQNAFTWIRVSLQCKHCGKKIRSFFDGETA